MKKIFLLLIVLLISLPAYADAFTFTWDAVTQDTAGNLSTPTGYKLYTSTSSGAYQITPTATIASPTTTYTLNITTPNTYFAVVTAYNAQGESLRSNEVTYTVTFKTPKAPTNLKVQ